MYPLHADYDCHQQLHIKFDFRFVRPIEPWGARQEKTQQGQEYDH